MRCWLVDADTLARCADQDNSRTATQEPLWLLYERRDVDALIRLADSGNNDAAKMLAGLLSALGDIEALTRRADVGDARSTMKLNEILHNIGDVEKLAARTDNGDRHASWMLAELLSARGDIGALTTRADNGDCHANQRLVDLLMTQGDVEALTQRATKDSYARRMLDQMHAQRDGIPDDLAKTIRQMSLAGWDPSEIGDMLGTGSKVVAKVLRQYHRSRPLPGIRQTWDSSAVR